MRANSTPTVVEISYDSLEEAAEVLASAFEDDPFIRYLFSGPDFSRHTLELFRFICAARLELGWPLIGTLKDGKITGVACVSAPEKKVWPASLVEIFERLKSDIGEEPVGKMERFSALSKKYAPARSHYLAAIGIHPEAQGRGLGKALLNAVHQISESDTGSTGVYLETGKQSNVSFYTHFGYRLISEDKLNNAVDFWFMFRPNQAGK